MEINNLTEGINTDHHFNSNLLIRFQIEFHYNESSYEIAVMYICFVILILGIIGNLFTMTQIVFESEFHTPTFVAIGYLALTDFFSIIFFGILYFTNMLMVDELSKHFSYVDNMLYFSSSGHVLLLSTVRYHIIVHPLQSRHHLTLKAVFFCSLSVWIWSALFAVVLTYINENILKVIVNIIALILVSSILILLHIRKINALHSSPSVTQQTQTRMNLVITAMISIFVLYHIFLVAEYLILHKLFVVGNKVKRSINLIVVVTGCLNYSCNPYILFFLTLYLRCK